MKPLLVNRAFETVWRIWISMITRNPVCDTSVKGFVASISWNGIRIRSIHPAFTNLILNEVTDEIHVLCANSNLSLDPRGQDSRIISQI